MEHCTGASNLHCVPLTLLPSLPSFQAAPRHTILLIQEVPGNAKTRVYADFPTKTKALEGIILLFEEALKQKNPHKKEISYSLDDLFAFMDGLGDIAALVLDPASNKYEPFAK